MRLLAAVVVLAGLQVIPTAPSAALSLAAARGSVSEAVAAPVASRTAAKPGKRWGYFVYPGVTFNDPDSNPYLIRSKVIRALDHARDGAKVKVMTWSFYDTILTNALIRAYDRGAVVRLIMSRSLSIQDEAGANFRRLRREIEGRQRPGPLSWARTCSNSCRGKGGSMHHKWMTISKTGRSDFVVMQGSANFNIRASQNQWNDWYTWAGNRKIYDVFQDVFRLAIKDKPSPAITLRLPKQELWFSPRFNDPILEVLDEVKCKGAGPAGRNGVTVIRVAASVITSNRGERIGQRLNQLDRAGCDLRVVYTLAPKGVRAAMAGVDMRQLAFDRDGDGLYDDYLHSKAMSVRGHVGDNRNAFYSYNGSANWSGLGQISDEQGMVVQGPKLARAFGRWVDGLYDKSVPPAAMRPTAMRQRNEDGEVINPYANLELELQ